MTGIDASETTFVRLVRAIFLRVGVGPRAAHRVELVDDPFTLFRDYGRYLTEQRYQRFVHAGLLRTTKDVQSLVVGTSYVANFNPDLTGHLFGGPAYILSTWGSSQRENNEAVLLALRLHPQIRTVLFEVSIWNVCSMKLHPFWTFPLALYKGYSTAVVAYLLSWKTADLSWRKRLGDAAVANPDRSQVVRWWDEHKHTFGNLDILQRSIAAVLPPPPTSVVMSQRDVEQRAKGYADCFRAHVLPIVARHPETEFLFFNPPVMQWLLWSNGLHGWLEPYMRAQANIAAMLGGVPNARWFDFYAATPEVSDCRHWRDMSHFDLTVSDQIVRWIKAGRFQRTPDNAAEFARIARNAAAQKIRYCASY